MTQCSKRIGNVSCEAPDIGALGNGGGEAGALSRDFEQFESVDRDEPGLEFDLFSRAGSRICRLAGNLQRRISGWNLFDLAGEGRERRFDLLRFGANVAPRGHFPFGIERIGLLAEADREIITLGRVEQPAAELGCFAKSDRQDSAGERVEGSAMPDLGLGLAGFPEDSLHRADGLGRTKSDRFVEDDPAAEHLQVLRAKIPRNRRTTSATIGETTRATTSA